MTWQRVELAAPVLRTRKQGRERFAYLRVADEPMAIMRVVSPTVAYVKRLTETERFVIALESVDTPFVSFTEQPAHAY